MLDRFIPKLSVVGLDIGRVTIKAAQITIAAKGPRLDGALCLRRTGQGGSLALAEGKRLARAMQRRGMSSQRLALVAPSEAVISSSINVPPPEGEVARDPIVKMELSRAHRLTPGAFEYAWWDLPASTSGKRIGQAHAVALSHAAMGTTLDTLDTLGYEVAMTLPVSVAMLAAAQRRPIDPRRIVAVMDLGANAGRLVLMHGGRVVHERALPDFNLRVIREALSASLGTTPEVTDFALGHFGLRDEPVGMVACETSALLNSALSALAEEIGMSFAFISHLYPEAELGPLLLAGGGANVPGLVHALSRELELEATVIAPGSLLGGESFGAESTDPAVTAALGAALCAALNQGGRR